MAKKKKISKKVPREKPRGPGQPPKPAEDRRTIVKEVAFSPAEWSRLEQLRGDEKPATFIRRKALGE